MSDLGEMINQIRRSYLACREETLALSAKKERRANGIGYFEGGYTLRRVKAGEWLYIPDAGDPLRFIRPDGSAVVVGETMLTTDMGSVPRLFWWLPGFAPSDMERPSVIHDALFERKHGGAPSQSFEETNAILAEALVAEGYPRWKARLLRWGCDTFGKRLWNKR